MNDFAFQLRTRNGTLFCFTKILVACSMLFFALEKLTSTQGAGVNAGYQSFKFTVCIVIYFGTMAWSFHYFPSFNIKALSWINIALFTVEIVYIAMQASDREEQTAFLAALNGI